MPSGDWLPPLNRLRESVIFYYTNATSGPQFWDREAKFWARDADHFTEASGTIKNAVSDLGVVHDPEETKARKIYAAVMKIDNRDFAHASPGREKPRGNKDAGGVWKQQSGTSDEIALLYVALARAAGLKAWPMQVVNRDRAEYEPTYLSMDQFDDYIVVVEIDGKEVYLDPGQRMCGFGVLHWKHEMAKGFRQTAKGVSIEQTPAGPPKAAGIQRIADISIDDKGAVSGSGRFVLSGQEALYWRQLALVEDSDELGKDFTDYASASLPDGTKAELGGFDGLTDYESDLTARLKFSGTLGSATGKRLILPGLLFEARGKHPFVAEESRSVAVDLHYATMELDEATYHFPAGVKADELPARRSLEWASRIGLNIEVTPAEGAVTVKRMFVRTATLVDPSYYNNLRAIYQQISSADQQQMVLSRVTEAGTN